LHAAPVTKRRRRPWILFAICIGLLLIGIAVSRPSIGQGASSLTPRPPAPAALPLTAFGNGDYAIGAPAPGRPAIVPGTYYSPGRVDDDKSCFWAREKDLSGRQESFIAYKLSDVPETVKILRTDVGFSTSGCIPWIRIGD
jgi:hypothetical protein